MKCDKSVEIAAYLKGETPAEEREALRLHYEQCVPCGQDLAKFDRVLKALGRMEEVDPSPGFKWRVREAFLQAHPEFLERPVAARVSLWESFDVPAWALSVAVHVLLIAIAAIMIFVPKSPEEELTDAAVRAVPRFAGRAAPEFPGGTGKPTPRERVGHFVPEDPTVEFIPGDRGAREPDFVVPFRTRHPGEEKLDAAKWKERLPRERRLLAFFDGRSTESQRETLRGAYGGKGTEKSIRKALVWLARAQQPDGRWTGPPVKMEDGTERPYAVGLTGLALLAFLAEGHTAKSGDYTAVVGKGIDYLLAQQRASGLVGAEQGNYMYDHAIAGLALLEASMMSRDEALSTAAAAAVNFTVAAQNASGGWGYVSRSLQNDTSVGGWQVLLLRTAKLGGNQGVITSLVQANERLLRSTDAEGRVGYWQRFHHPNGYHALTAVGMLAHQLSTHTPDAELLAKQAAILSEVPPVAAIDPSSSFLNDLYFGYFASLALHQHGGDAWTKLYGTLSASLMKAQQSDGAWPAAFDRWHAFGGPVYSTAMGALILQTPIRYPRLFE